MRSIITNHTMIRHPNLRKMY